MFSCDFEKCPGHPTEINFCTFATRDEFSSKNETKDIRRQLREDNEAEFEGVKLVYAGEWESLRPGDSYIAQRNTGPHLLTVKRVYDTPNKPNRWSGWVISNERAYTFDLGECVKVEIQI